MSIVRITQQGTNSTQPVVELIGSVTDRGYGGFGFDLGARLS